MKTEKISVNLSPVELGQIDYLVERGLYDSRSDFMRSAARKVLEGHADKVKEFLEPENFNDEPVHPVFVLGAGVMSKSHIQRAIANNLKLKIRVIGLCTVPDNVTPDEIRQAVISFKVYGKLIASKEVRAVLEEIEAENNN